MHRHVVAILLAAIVAGAEEPTHEGKTANEWVPLLSDKDAAVRAQAATALGFVGMGFDKAIPSLQRVAKDKDAAVREAAGAALDRILGEITWKQRRDAKERDRLVARGGGGKATEEAVLSALGWLARHQEADGRWSATDFAKHCEKSTCDGLGIAAHDYGLTGLAVLAFLGAGIVPDPAAKGSQLVDAVAGGVQWLLAHQAKDGMISAPSDSHCLYHHALGTMALCETYGMTRDQALRPNAEAAVRFLVDAKNPARAWRYQPKSGENDVSATGWCLMALKSASMAGIKVPPYAWCDVYAYLGEATDPKSLKVGYTGAQTAGVKVVSPGKNDLFAGHDTMTAIAVLGRLTVARDAKDPWVKAAAPLLAADLPAWDDSTKPMDYYYWYYGTLALFQHGRGEGADLWKRWNAALTKTLLESQKDGNAACGRGSWDPCDRWGFEGGRIYATAMNALSLEVYYRYADSLALGKRVDVDLPADPVMEAREKLARELVNQGIQSEKKRNRAEAIRVYTEASTTYPETKAGKEAASRLKSLGK